MKRRGRRGGFHAPLLLVVAVVVLALTTGGALAFQGFFGSRLSTPTNHHRVVDKHIQPFLSLERTSPTFLSRLFAEKPDNEPDEKSEEAAQPRKPIPLVDVGASLYTIPNLAENVPSADEEAPAPSEETVSSEEGATEESTIEDSESSKPKTAIESTLEAEENTSSESEEETTVEEESDSEQDIVAQEEDVQEVAEDDVVSEEVESIAIVEPMETESEPSESLSVVQEATPEIGQKEAGEEKSADSEEVATDENVGGETSEPESIVDAATLDDSEEQNEEVDTEAEEAGEISEPEPAVDATSEIKKVDPSEEEEEVVEEVKETGEAEAVSNEVVADAEEAENPSERELIVKSTSEPEEEAESSEEEEKAEQVVDDTVDEAKAESRAAESDDTDASLNEEVTVTEEVVAAAEAVQAEPTEEEMNVAATSEAKEDDTSNDEEVAGEVVADEEAAAGDSSEPEDAVEDDPTPDDGNVSEAVVVDADVVDDETSEPGAEDVSAPETHDIAAEADVPEEETIVEAAAEDTVVSEDTSTDEEVVAVQEEEESKPVAPKPVFFATLQTKKDTPKGEEAVVELEASENDQEKTEEKTSPSIFFAESADELETNEAAAENVENVDPPEQESEPPKEVVEPPKRVEPPKPKGPSPASLAAKRAADVFSEVKNDEKVGEFLGAVGDLTVRGSLALLKGLRWGAANALTASLPKEDREELMNRMNPDAAPPELPSTQADDTDDVKLQEEVVDEAITFGRGSVQEEIAAAVREEARLSEEKWQAEKELITEQIQQAANERIQTELAIQQRRLEEEKMSLQQQLDVALERRDAELRTLQADALQRNAEMKTLQEKLESYKVIEKEYEASMQEAQEKMDDEAIQQEQYKLQAVKSLLKKRQEQQSELEMFEEKLRVKAEEIKAEKEQLTQKARDMKAERARLAQEAQEIEELSQATPEGEEGIPYLSPKDYRSLSPEEKAELKARRRATKATQDEISLDGVHPVLGPVVADLGYKRIHLVPSGKLGTIPIWKKQRIYNNGRARAMAADKAKSMDLGFPGVICIYEDRAGKLSILDGQHRVGMMQVLREMQNKATEATGSSENDGIFQNVLVEVYPQPADETEEDDDKHPEEVFLEINKAEPVKLVDMPGVASAADRKIISSAVRDLEAQFPKMFSPSQRCRTPNVNPDNLRNTIFGANILRRHRLNTAKKLLDWLLMQNASQGDKYENNPEQREFVSVKAWEKASAFGFYLGLDSSWLYL